MFSGWIIYLMAALFMAEKALGCDNLQVANCLAPFMRHPYLERNAAFFSYSEPKLKVLCRAYKTARTCFTPLLAECSSGEQCFLGGLTSIMKYICEETNDRDIEYHPCLSKDSFNEEGRLCQVLFEGEMYDILHRNSSTIDSSINNVDGRFTVQTKYNSEYCRMWEENIFCLHIVCRQFCGEAAAEWHACILAKAIQPSCPSINVVENCFADPRFKWVEPLIFTGIGLGIVAVVVCCGACICYRCRRKQQHNGFEKPPPYDDVSPPPYESAKSPPSYEDITHVVTVSGSVIKD